MKTIIKITWYLFLGRYSPIGELSDSTPERMIPSQKRKVGRPKKLMSSPGFQSGTETIVAKKPKAGSFVGYLLAAKQKLRIQQSQNGLVYSDSPPRYVEESTKKSKSHHKTKNNNNNIIVSGEKRFSENSCKIRPKLKAEATVKTYTEEDEVNNEWEDDKKEEADAAEEEPEVVNVTDNEEVDIEIDEEVETQIIERKQEIPEVNKEEPVRPTDDRCFLTVNHLEMEKLRVLTAMGGLFYAGRLNAVEPPDVYSITLDGERGNRPHIMSREEILRDAVSTLFINVKRSFTVRKSLCYFYNHGNLDLTWHNQKLYFVLTR